MQQTNKAVPRQAPWHVSNGETIGTTQKKNYDMTERILTSPDVLLPETGLCPLDTDKGKQSLQRSACDHNFYVSADHSLDHFFLLRIQDDIDDNIGKTWPSLAPTVLLLSQQADNRMWHWGFFDNVTEITFVTFLPFLSFVLCKAPTSVSTVIIFIIITVIIIIIVFITCLFMNMVRLNGKPSQRRDVNQNSSEQFHHS